MATITQSTLAQQGAQADGRKHVVEVHTDSLGNEYRRSYLADAGADLNALLAAHATQIAADLAANELTANVAGILANGSLFSPTFNWSTAAQLRTAGRAAYQASTKVEAIMIGDFLSTLTNNQLATIFGMTAGQVNTLRSTKLDPAAARATDIRAALGQ